MRVRVVKWLMRPLKLGSEVGKSVGFGEGRPREDEMLASIDDMGV